MKGLKETFDEHFEHVKFDGKLAKAIYEYQIGFVNSNREHLEFFGSNLLGVHVIRFKDRDVDRFFDQVLDVDLISLERDIRKVDTINHEFKISGDILNLTLMYVIHRFLTAPTLPEKQRHRGAYDTALIFFYRSVAALMSYYFTYPSDPKIAQLAYSRLSNKFLIKKLGSWQKVMDYRSEELLDRSESIHIKALISFKDDLAIVYAINDSQSRIKDMIKNYYSEFISVHSEGANIGVTSSTFNDADGEETLKEKTKSTENYVQYMLQSLSDEHTFIKDDILGVIVRINANTSFRMVKSTLQWMYENQNNQKYNKNINEFISKVVVQSLYFIQHNMQPKSMRDYPYILQQLKNLYLSTRTEDKDVDKIRDLGLKIVQSSNKGVSSSLTLATRTSVILYITLRALIGQN